MSIWTCPFCGLHQTVTKVKTSTVEIAFEIHDCAGGPMGLRGIAVGCSNESCKKVQVTAEVITAKTGQIGF